MVHDNTARGLIGIALVAFIGGFPAVSSGQIPDPVPNGPMATSYQEYAQQTSRSPGLDRAGFPWRRR